MSWLQKTDMSDKIPPELVIQQTRAWVSDFIIAHNICPFARKELERGGIHYEVFQEHRVEETLTGFIELCQLLDKNGDIGTALFILPSSFIGFNDYLDLLDMANALLIKQGYEDVYQLASFHPDYCFEGADCDDASNYTNRSPYPMLHIIREDALEKALEKYPNPESIPERNIAYCRKLGKTALANILQDCM
jgi:hypothetical protein